MTFDKVIFDWKRTLYDPATETLIQGAIELLKFLKKKNVPMMLIGKGGRDMQSEVKKLKIGKYFRQVIFEEGKKNFDLFIPFISKDDSKKTAFIGDRVRSELEIGNKLGATTIWVKQGKFAEEEPEDDYQKPDFIVKSLKECLELLLRLN